MRDRVLPPAMRVFNPKKCIAPECAIQPRGSSFPGVPMRLCLAHDGFAVETGTTQSAPSLELPASTQTRSAAPSPRPTARAPQQISAACSRATTPSASALLAFGSIFVHWSLHTPTGFSRYCWPQRRLSVSVPRSWPPNPIPPTFLGPGWLGGPGDVGCPFRSGSGSGKGNAPRTMEDYKAALDGVVGSGSDHLVASSS